MGRHKVGGPFVRDPRAGEGDLDPSQVQYTPWLLPPQAHFLVHSSFFGPWGFLSWEEHQVGRRGKRDQKQLRWRLGRGFRALLGLISQMGVCIGIPICSCTGRGSVDDPLEDPKSDVARGVRRNSSTDLDSGDQRHGCPSKL